jgi:CelD/BcsL family acetyltransferase involved in cellulose biosynthesis
MNCLRRREADVAMLDDVAIDSPLYRLALKLPGFLSRDTLPKLQGHDAMTVPGSIEEVLQCLSAHRRHELRRTAKKLQNNPVGEPKLVCYRDPTQLDRLFHDAEEIARKTYQRGLGVGFADTLRVRERLELAALKGWLRAYLLYLGDRPCAFWIGMLYGETFVSDYTGYDPELRQLSPGTGLLMRMIERFCNRSDGDVISELDFGPGDAEYKTALCTRKWLEAVVYIFSPTLKGLALKSVRTVTRVVNVLARKVLIFTKLSSWARRAWRGRLAKHAEKTSPKN